MHRKQYSRQLEKRKRITDQTLVIGMDIGSEFNAACFMDKEGNEGANRVRSFIVAFLLFGDTRDDARYVYLKFSLLQRKT